MDAPLPRLRAVAERLLGWTGAAVDSVPRNDWGVPLDRWTWRFLQVAHGSGVRDYPSMTPARARAQQRRFAPLVGLPPRPLRRVEDATIPGPAGPLPVRVYQPDAAQGGGPLPPLLVYFHGGGFVTGDLDTHDGLCRTLAADGDHVVVSVDYRLAPEHPYPAAIADAVAATRHLRAHAGRFGATRERLVVAGDSAGAALATLVCHHLRAHGELQPALQVLLYPCTDLRRVHASHRRFADGYLLTAPMLDWFLGHYLPDPALAADPGTSPLLVERFDGLAPALIWTAGFDPLRDEGIAYAEALAAAGVPVEHRCHARLVHGFCSLAGVVPAARAAVHELADRLRRGQGRAMGEHAG